jgi:SAM-dependent methyltransferase
MPRKPANKPKARARRAAAESAEQSAAPLGELAELDLYERCVQNPQAAVKLLLGIHGGGPRHLAEDFCGSGALSRAWLEMVARSTATALDLDPVPLQRLALLGRGAGQRLRIVHGDALATPLERVQPVDHPRPDVLFVGNFSIGEIHRRLDLVAYFKRCAVRLAAGGVMVCDTYGGPSAWRTGSVQRMVSMDGTGRVRIRYTWEQRSADPLTARVVCALHFRVVVSGEVVQERTDAFVYRWRLWSVPELREAMLEAGLRSAEVYGSLPDAQDNHGNYLAVPLRDGDDLDDDDGYIVCVAGRKA